MKKNIYMEKKKIVKVECLQFKIDKEGKCQHNESGSTEGSENKNKNKHYKAQLKRGTETQPERSIGNILKQGTAGSLTLIVRQGYYNSNLKKEGRPKPKSKQKKKTKIIVKKVNCIGKKKNEDSIN